MNRDRNHASEFGNDSFAVELGGYVSACPEAGAQPPKLTCQEAARY